MTATPLCCQILPLSCWKKRSLKFNRTNKVFSQSSFSKIAELLCLDAVFSFQTIITEYSARGRHQVKEMSMQAFKNWQTCKWLKIESYNGKCQTILIIGSITSLLCNSKLCFIIVLNMPKLRLPVPPLPAQEQLLGNGKLTSCSFHGVDKRIVVSGFQQLERVHLSSFYRAEHVGIWPLTHFSGGSLQ